MSPLPRPAVVTVIAPFRSPGIRFLPSLSTHFVFLRFLHGKEYRTYMSAARSVRFHLSWCLQMLMLVVIWFGPPLSGSPGISTHPNTVLCRRTHHPDLGWSWCSALLVCTRKTHSVSVAMRDGSTHDDLVIQGKWRRLLCDISRVAPWCYHCPRSHSDRLLSGFYQGYRAHSSLISFVTRQGV
jgi:hypothetical protein